MVAGISLVANYRETFAQEVPQRRYRRSYYHPGWHKNKQVDAKNEKKS